MGRLVALSLGRCGHPGSAVVGDAGGAVVGDVDVGWLLGDATLVDVGDHIFQLDVGSWDEKLMYLQNPCRNMTVCKPSNRLFIFFPSTRKPTQVPAGILG